MARRLDQILVIDIEATCWDGPPPEGQENEIIDIWAVSPGRCHGTAPGENQHSGAPQRSTISDYCTALTTLTQGDVDGGTSLDEACELLKQRYESKSRLWASFGDYDRRQFERNCQVRGIPYPFGPGHINVKSLLAAGLGLHRELALDAAMRHLGFPQEGTHHRGHDDAWNIARILAELLSRIRQEP